MGLQLLTLNDLGRDPEYEIPSWAPDWSSNTRSALGRFIQVIIRLRQMCNSLQRSKMTFACRYDPK